MNLPNLIINLELARRVIGYLALLRFLFQQKFPSCDFFKIVRQISLPSIRENWTGKKEMSCTFKATTLTRWTGDNVFPKQIRV